MGGFYGFPRSVRVATPIFQALIRRYLKPLLMIHDARRSLQFFCARIRTQHTFLVTLRYLIQSTIELGKLAEALHYVSRALGHHFHLYLTATTILDIRTLLVTTIRKN